MPPDDRDQTDDANLPPLADAWDVFPDEPIPVIEPEPEPDKVFCARCGETDVPVASCCLWCGAWLVGPRPRPRAAPVYTLDDEPEDDWHTEVARVRRVVPVAAPLVPPLVVVFVSYGLLLGSLIGFAVLAALYGLAGEEDMFTALALTEVATSALTVVAAGLVWRQARQRLPEGTVLLTWLVAIPVLAALLCLNITYITFLRELLRPFGTPQGMTIQVTLTTVLLICVQPAIFEELFFRQMTLGVFRRSMNMHLAVWLTAALFAFAHLGNPLGMPYLFLAGGVFGYARVYGGLPLAVVMHFVHNFVVIAYEASK